MGREVEHGNVVRIAQQRLEIVSDARAREIGVAPRRGRARSREQMATHV